MSLQITESQYDRLQTALANAQRIAQAQAELEKQDAENRALLLELFNETGASNKDIPGIELAVTTDIKFDDTEALTWALNDANYMQAASILNVRASATGSVLAMVKDDPKRAGFFEVNKTGYKKAAREGLFIGLPITGEVTTQVLRLTKKDLLSGDALRAKFEVVPDPEPEAEQELAGAAD